MILQALFDESLRENGVLSVGGFAFVPRQLKEFNKEWVALFPHGCHMKELSQRRGRFKAITQEQSNALLVSAIKIINHRSSFGVCASVDMDEMQRVMPAWIKGLEHPYPILCHMAMTSLGLLMEDRGGGYSIDYVFEAGHFKQKAADFWMRYAIVVPELSRSFCYRSHRFAANSAEPGLQAADILAWEWAKYMDETVGRRNAGEKHRPMRRSLIALFTNGQEGSREPRFDKYNVAHVTGDSLARFAEKVKEQGLEQVQEEFERRAPASSSS